MHRPSLPRRAKPAAPAGELDHFAERRDDRECEVKPVEIIEAALLALLFALGGFFFFRAWHGWHPGWVYPWKVYPWESRDWIHRESAARLLASKALVRRSEQGPGFFDAAGLETSLEPAHTLRRGAVGESVGHDGRSEEHTSELQ